MAGSFRRSARDGYHRDLTAISPELIRADGDGDAFAAGDGGLLLLMAGVDVLQKQIAKQGGFARTSLPDDVNVSARVMEPDAERLVGSKNCALTYVQFVHGGRVSRDSIKTKTARALRRQSLHPAYAFGASRKGNRD